jgi:hypothetical protein
MRPPQHEFDRETNSWSSYEFERFAGDVVSHALDRPEASVYRGDDIGIDYILKGPHDELILVEVKSDTPSTQRRIEDISDRLRAVAEKTYPSRRPRLVLVVPGVIRQDGVNLLGSQGIQVVDGPKLVKAAESANVAIPQGIQITRPVNLVKPVGYQLQRRLRNLEPGRPAWSAYQKLCTETFEYLFSPPLGVPRPELPDASLVNRRDAIMANYADSGYWQFMRMHYHADFIVIDAKNYKNAIKKPAVLQLANYLSQRGPGLFGMIATRVGADAGATWTIREQWVLHSKLIVVLNDDDLNQMLTARDAGAEPWAVIRQKVEDFRLGV